MRFRILKFLSWKSPASIKEISQAVEKDRRHVRDKLREMELRGEVFSRPTWERGPGCYFYQVHKRWMTLKGSESLESLTG